MTIDSILKKYDKAVINKFRDFLLSEIDSDEDIIIVSGFLMENNDEMKLSKYADMMYSSGEFEGTYLDGNQYLISGDNYSVHIIDTLKEHYDKDSITELVFDTDEFIFLIRNKKDFLLWCMHNNI